MTQLRLRLIKPEQDIIDNFGIDLVRENIDNNQKRKIIEKLLHYKRFTDIGDVNCSFSDLFMTRSDTYFVYNGHAVGIMVGSPNYESDLKFLPENLGDLSELAFLLIMGTQIERIPSSIGKLKNLRFLEIFGIGLLFSFFHYAHYVPKFLLKIFISYFLWLFLCSLFPFNLV